MHEKAKLYKRVSGMFGGRVPPKDYDFTKLEGLNYDLLIVHQTGKDGKVYANIAGTVARAKDAPKLEIVKIDPPKGSSPTAAQQDTAAVFGSGSAVTAGNPITDEDIPF